MEGRAQCTPSNVHVCTSNLQQGLVSGGFQSGLHVCAGTQSLGPPPTRHPPAVSQLPLPHPIFRGQKLL